MDAMIDGVQGEDRAEMKLKNEKTIFGLTPQTIFSHEKKCFLMKRNVFSLNERTIK